MDLIDIVELLGQFLAIMLVITLHEFSHAFAAYKCGDPTAKYAGRMTLNPVKHFDLLGVLMFLLSRFGWAKPVPINPNNFDNYKKGAFWTSIAGVLCNYVTAFAVYPLYLLVQMYVLPHLVGMYAFYFVYGFFSALVLCSLSFCVFNLLPFYPLDGFRVIDALNKKRGKVYQFLAKYGYYILFGLVFISFMADRIVYFRYIDILGFIMNYAIEWISKPITLFWGWIFGIMI